MKSWLINVNERIYKVERASVGYIFLAMAGVVFVDVLHRVFSRTPGRLSVLFGGLFGTTVENFETYLSPVIIGLALFVISYFAIKSNHKMKQKPLARSKNLGLAIFVTTLVSALVQLFLYFDPEGIVWAPYFGLAGLLWIGFIGASMATHTNQHLLLEMGEKIWPEKMLPGVRTLAHLLVAVFVLVIAYLGALSVIEHLHDWQSGPAAGLVPSIGWPKWIVYLVIPYSFLMMACRFLGIGLGIFKPVKITEF